MFKARDKETVRERYLILQILKDPEFLADADMTLVDEWAKEIKREVRAWTHRNPYAVEVDNGVTVERRMVKGDYDGYLELVHLPGTIKTRDEADEFFERYMTYRPTPSMYDCTGRAFTVWFLTFKRHGEFYAYHSVGMDV